MEVITMEIETIIKIALLIIEVIGLVDRALGIMRRKNAQP